LAEGTSALRLVIVRTPHGSDLALIVVALLPVVAAAPARAQEVWRGDFETGDTSQFDGELNGTVGGSDQITLVEDPVTDGVHAARIELVNEAVWPNGLKRVELHHSPASGRTDEGNETYFAWSFFLPETLPRDPEQTIGYWESDASYRQLMAFAVIGTDLRFSTNRPDWTEHWTGTGVITPGVWHRIAMHILFSEDAAVGTVDVWFDGVQVVTGAHASFLADANSAFTQIGLLRGAIEFTDAPVIFLDDAIEGDSLESVRPDALSAAPDAGTSADAGGSSDPDASSSDAAGLDAAVGATVDAARTDAGPRAALMGSCGCRVEGHRPTPALGVIGSLLALVLVRRHR
jgi:hypothetical protein